MRVVFSDLKRETSYVRNLTRRARRGGRHRQVEGKLDPRRAVEYASVTEVPHQPREERDQTTDGNAHGAWHGKEEAQGKDTLSQRGGNDSHDTASQGESVTRSTRSLLLFYTAVSPSRLRIHTLFLLLQKKMTTLIRSIIEEKDACVELRVQLAVHQLMAKT